LRWLMRLFRKRKLDNQLDAELRFHIEQRTADLVAAGIEPAEARRRTMIEFGGVERAKEECRETRGSYFLETFLLDLRYALRTLRKSPAFAVVAILTLALGIAMNTAIFSLVDAFLLTPPSVAHPERVAVITDYYAHNGGWYFDRISPLDYLAFRSRLQAFSGLTAAAPSQLANLNIADTPQRVTMMAVRPNFFAVLGVHPRLGRAFVPSEDQPGHGRVALLSSKLWRTQFGNDPKILGRRIEINGRSYTVVGIMPHGFSAPRATAQIWIPLVFGPQQLTAEARASRFLTLFGRLRPGAHVAEASTQVNAVMAELASRYEPDRQWRAYTTPLVSFASRQNSSSQALELLMMAVGLVLMIACANVAGLLLARAGARRHELALRAALGAGRGRLLRQLLAESLLLALAGGTLGLALAGGGIRLLNIILKPGPGSTPVLDFRVVLFAAAVSGVTVLLFGLAPAWQAADADPQSALRAGGRGATGARGHARLRRWLIGGEVALAVVLLAAAGILIRSVAAELSPAQFGFNPQQLTTVYTELPQSFRHGAVAWADGVNAIATRLRHLPGVAAAGCARSLPLMGSGATSVSTEPGIKSSGETHGAAFYPVSPGYLAAMQIPLLRGRDITGSDVAAAPPVVLVDRVFVRRYFHGQNPVGRFVYVHFFDYLNRRGRLVNSALHPRRVEVVGVTGRVQRILGIPQDEPAMYVPLAQWPSRGITAVVRAAAPPAAPEIGRAIWSAAGQLAVVGQVTTMRQLIDENSRGDKLVAGLMSIFAAMALLLALIGIYGVIAYLAGQRASEISVRLALGARPSQITAMILREAAAFGGAGWLVGMALAAQLPRLFAALFDGTNIPAIARASWPAAALIVPLAVLAAAWWPASRAARLDPVQCLRRE
jgi:predicted permease